MADASTPLLGAGPGAVQGYTKQGDGTLALNVSTTSGSGQAASSLSKVVSANTSGSTPLLAATPGQTNRVHGLRLSVAGAVVVSILDGATLLERFNFAGNGGGIVLDLREKPYYTGSVNTALNISLSAAVQVDGRLEYVTGA